MLCTVSKFPPIWMFLYMCVCVFVCICIFMSMLMYYICSCVCLLPICLLLAKGSTCDMWVPWWFTDWDSHQLYNEKIQNTHVLKLTELNSLQAEFVFLLLIMLDKTENYHHIYSTNQPWHDRHWYISKGKTAKNTN